MKKIILLYFIIICALTIKCSAYDADASLKQIILNSINISEDTLGLKENESYVICVNVPETSEAYIIRCEHEQWDNQEDIDSYTLNPPVKSISISKVFNDFGKTKFKTLTFEGEKAEVTNSIIISTDIFSTYHSVLGIIVKDKGIRVNIFYKTRWQERCFFKYAESSPAINQLLEFCRLHN